MTQDEYQALKAAGDITEEAQPQGTPPSPPEHSSAYRFEDFLPLLVELLSPKQYLIAAPNFVPRNFLEAIQLMDDGVNRRVYFYMNGSWRYTALT